MGAIIAKQTGAKTSEIIVLTREPFPKTIQVTGLLTTEAISVHIVDSAGDSTPLYGIDGYELTLTVNSQPLTVPSPVLLQFVKPETANAVGVELVEINV